MRRPERIRLAKADECQSLTALALRSKAHWGYPAEFIEACRDELTVDPQRLTSPEFAYRVAERDGTIVGFCGLRAHPNHDVELDALFVEPASIGGGIGRALLEDALSVASRMDGERLTIQGDPNADAFYLAAGATRIGERESGSIPGRFLPLYEILLRR